MPASQGGGGGGRALRERSGRENNTDSQSTQDNGPQHQLAVTGLEITTYPPGFQHPAGTRRRAADDRRKTAGRGYQLRTPPRKREFLAKLKLFLEKEAPPGTTVSHTTLTAQMGAGVYTAATVIETDADWTQLLATMKDNVHKPVKLHMEWTKEAPMPTPPPTPSPAVPTPAPAATQSSANQIFSWTGADPPPPYQQQSSSSSSSRARSGPTTARGRARQHAEEMDAQRHGEINNDEEITVALWDKHPRCQEHSRGHTDKTHCYVQDGRHYRLNYNAVATWATAVREAGASMLSPPPHVFQMLNDFTPRQRGSTAATQVAAEALQIIQGTSGSSSTAAAAATSSSNGNAGAVQSTSSGPVDMGNAKAWTVWGLDKRDGGLNKGLATSLFKQNVKTMCILARAHHRGVLGQDFALTGVEMMIIEQWIEDWRVLEEDESSVERENSIIEMRSAAAGE